MSWTDERYYEAFFSVSKSRRYHAAMREFYRRCADAVTAVTALTGTSAFVALFLQDRESVAAKWLIGTVAAASTLNVVFGFNKKADLHDGLCKRFTLLAAEMELWPADETHLAQARSRRTVIEADEPAVRRVVDLRAHNDQMRGDGVDPDGLLPLSWMQKRTWLGYFCDFGMASMEKRWIAQKERSAIKTDQSN